MKKFLYILTLLCLINTPTFAYGIYDSPGSCNSYRSTSLYLAPSRQPGITQTSQQLQYRIGYTTNYGNTFGYTTQQTYSGTYNPGTGSNSSGRPGQPRRVHGYTGDGNYVGDDNGSESDFWEDGYEYYWDDVDKCWYRYSASDGWRKHNHTLGFLLGWHWALTSWGGRRPPSNSVTKGYEENPVPIGDPDFYLITALLFSYFIYIYMKKRRQRFLLYTGI